VKVSYGLPTHHVDPASGLATGEAVVALSQAAEAAGFDAVYVTEHPFPADDWLAGGGHHALDPMVALAVAGTATERVRLHTNLFIPSYRNPFLAAKAISSLDVLTGGRVILGVGSGYLEGEFKALGVDMASRNDATDEAIRAMKAAWTGESVVLEGQGWAAEGNTMLPRPLQQPHPPIWIGGNSKRAIRRAVELGQGWSPFPNPPSVAARTRTAALLTPEDLAGQLDYAREHAAKVGRTEPLEVAFIPKGLSMRQREEGLQVEQVVSSCTALSEVGVGWVTVAFPGDDVGAQLESIAEFGESVLPAVAPLQAPTVCG
jgi:probable F420-dependent oxidoreductase